jgi:hypothetical protein
MKKNAAALLVSLCLLLTGCTSWMDGSYAWMEPYSAPGVQEDKGISSVSTYLELRQALSEMVESGEETRMLSVAGMQPNSVEENMKLAIHYAVNSHPVGAYAVESIHYELGTTSGLSAVMVTVTYNHNRTEIQKIRTVHGMNSAKERIMEALNGIEPGIVLKVTAYEDIDYAQYVQDYALLHPDMVMEIPQVTASVYPASGSIRVVELKFTYQTSRESLKSMQNYVQAKFSSAELFVKIEEDNHMKFARLYAFLMETTDYTVETSITAAYSLLRHGVGNSKAFASVYAAMCRKAGLDCQVISGTRAGEPWFWNIICEDGTYYHVDLLRSYQDGAYRKMADADMVGYVWDYTAFPACGAEDVPPEETQPTTEETTDGAA